MRGLSILFFGLAAFALALVGLSKFSNVHTASHSEGTLELTPVEWADLDGWRETDPGPALRALQKSCAVSDGVPEGRPKGGGTLRDGTAVYGTYGDWVDVCLAAQALGRGEGAVVRKFFETWFLPLRVENINQRGLFTGYYEPELEGSLAQSLEYPVPLLARPSDLVMVDLGDFRDTLKGQRIAGRVEHGYLLPYESRAEIERGALADKTRPLAFVKDPVDAFFLHIQGSGRIRLPDGQTLRVGYDGQNGHPYTPIGRVLIEEGELQRDNVTMQSIRAWLADNPNKRQEILNANASYIFFRDLKIANSDLGPLGAEGVPLTPLYSLAIDRKFHALGVPMWVDSSLPGRDGPFRQLMVAQDTGGAILGPVRGDIFFGFGGDAPRLAGAMKQPGNLTVLLPRQLAKSPGG